MVDSDRDFPHPFVAVDVVLVAVREGRLETVVLERRDEEPRGWALPGAFVRIDESVEDAAARVVREKLGLRRKPRLWALEPFGKVHRDKRRRVISLPHVALVEPDRFEGRKPKGPQPVEVATVDVDPLRVGVRGQPTRLVFDHMQMLEAAVEHLAERVELGDDKVLRDLLPERFPVRRLQEVHDALRGTASNKDSFRRRMAPRLRPTGERESGVDHRPATLFSWAPFDEEDRSSRRRSR